MRSRTRRDVRGQSLLFGDEAPALLALHAKTRPRRVFFFVWALQDRSSAVWAAAKDLYDKAFVDTYYMRPFIQAQDIAQALPADYRSVPPRVFLLIDLEHRDENLLSEVRQLAQVENTVVPVVFTRNANWRENEMELALALAPFGNGVFTVPKMEHNVFRKIRSVLSQLISPNWK